MAPVMVAWAAGSHELEAHRYCCVRGGKVLDKGRDLQFGIFVWIDHDVMCS